MTLNLVHTGTNGRPSGPETISALDAGLRVGRVFFRRLPGCIEITSVETLPSHQRQGVGRALLGELESRFPHIPLDHGLLTEEGLAFNAAIYGPALHGELTAIHQGDSDGPDFDLGALDYGDTLYRGGWTLDGRRVTRDEARGSGMGEPRSPSEPVP